jgi:serine carboxypeptidase-like clade 2
MKSLLLALALLSVVAANSGGKIKKLPGYSGPQLSMYSGYITVDEESNRNLFYWLVEAESGASEKPLIVWYQGGPGCSGLYGLFGENGPLRATANGVVYSDLAWTKFANMLYLEQPAFVGFSYSDNPLDNNTDDAKAARDNYVFLQQFMLQYPQYQGRDLYFAGGRYSFICVYSFLTRHRIVCWRLHSDARCARAQRN